MHSYLTRYEVTIRDTMLGIDGLIDMMRYDQSRVVEGHRDGEALVVTLETERYAGPEERRWRSFGIEPKIVGMWRVKRDGSRVPV